MVKALVDSDCSYPLFFSQHILDMLKILVIPLPTPIDVSSANQHSIPITHQTQPELIGKGKRGRCDNTERERRIFVRLEKSTFVGGR
jgi:hypothetical protein